MSFREVVDPDMLLELNSVGQSPTASSTGGMTLVTDQAMLDQLNKGFNPEIEAVRASQLLDVVDPEPEDPETWADWISPVLEIGSSLAVAGPATAKGAAAGSVFGPPGAFLGGLGAGVTATTVAVYGSRLAGEGVEALIEGREFNPDLAVQEAMDAAQTEALFSTVFGVKNYIDSYGKYMGEQAEQLLLSFKAAGPTKQGEVLQALITQTDQALREIVDPLYKNIDALGKKVTVRSSEKAASLADSFKKDFRAKPRYTDKGKLIESSLVEYPTSATKTAVNYLETIPNDLSFFEAHKRLSKVKARLNKAIRSTEQDPDRIEVLAATADMLKEAMDEAAGTLSPALKKQYDEVTDMYNKGKNVVTSTYLKKALEVNDPVQIGAMLTADGLTYGIKEVKELKKLAAQYKARLPKDSKIKGLDADPMEGIRKGFLAQVLKVGPDSSIQSFQQLRKKLAEPKFKETFDELFKGTATQKQLDTLFDELSILERVQSGGSGFQLAVAQGEISAVRNPKVLVLLRGFIPSFLAAREISSKNIDKVINMIKTAKTAENKGVVLPKGFEERLQQLLTGQKVGLGLGALVSQVPE
jgi:hypothetical protein